MGELNVVLPKSTEEIQDFVRRVLSDTRALERMIVDDLFDREGMHIGAEQEMNLIDKHFKPSNKNLQVLEELNHPLFTTELARFNMECNVDPILFQGKCLSEMDQQISMLIEKAQLAARKHDCDVIMMGILPTIRKSDLVEECLTPIPRYKALMKAIIKLRGESNLNFNIGGIDELSTLHNSPLPEACNTGFQVHMQVHPDDFARKYNLAQAICGPALAPAVNSPILFGKRLWQETRIALFQQSVDTRVTRENLRDRSPRVMFGNKWLDKSILEIYKEDIMRFRVMLSNTNREDSFQLLKQGKIPGLMALQVHNGTVYRWNRPCYGNAGNVPHLRIENRVLPAGPTIKDEMANAALWLGLLNSLDEHYPDITKQLDFDDAKNNFLAACRYGLDATFDWVKGKKITARELLLKELIPLAKEGLSNRDIAKEDSDYYMGIIEERVRTGRTGSQWMLSSWAQLRKEETKDQTLLAITSSTLQNQIANQPVHEWDLASTSSLQGSEVNSLTVEDFMNTDLFTVQKDDVLDLVEEMMNTQRIKYVPVENDAGHLVGLVTNSKILRLHRQVHLQKQQIPSLTAADVMIEKPIQTTPQTPIRQALEAMQRNKIGCLPVVNDNKELIGIITEQDFLKITLRLMNRLDRNN